MPLGLRNTWENISYMICLSQLDKDSALVNAGRDATYNETFWNILWEAAKGVFKLAIVLFGWKLR